jgi:hypothetical protein
MLLTPLDEQYRFRVNIRPIKTAYFVREDDRENLIRTLRLISTQWGGIRNLIIPVRPNLTIAPFFEHILKLHEPDWFVSCLVGTHEDDYEIARERSREHGQFQVYLSQLFPDRQIDLQIRDFLDERDITAHPLSIISDEDLNVYDPDPLQPFRARGQVLSTHELFLKTDDDYRAADELINLVLFGSIFPGQEDDYSQLLRIQKISVDMRERLFWECQFQNSPFSSVLNLTTYGVRLYTATGVLESPHFDIVLVNSFNSLCWYWNLRGLREVVQHSDLGRHTLLLPIELLDDVKALEQLLSFISENITYPSHHSNLDISFRVWDNESAELLKGVLPNLPSLEPLDDDKISFTYTWGTKKALEETNAGKQKLSYSFAGLSYVDNYRETAGLNPPIVTNLNLKSNELLLSPPTGFRNRYGGATAVDFECDVWNRYPDNRFIAESIKAGSRFSPYGLSMITTTPDQPRLNSFNLPDEWETLRIHFESKGYQVRLSRDGQYSDAIVSLVGGLNGIELLASKESYLLLDMLALKSTKKIAQRIVNMLGIEENRTSEIEYLFNEMEIAPELKGLPKTYRQLSNDPRLKPYRSNLLNLLNRLSEAEVIKRGFYLDCPHCGAPDWYPLLSINERLTCSGCSNNFGLPVEMPVGTEIQWQYRLNTLINRAVDQDVLPNILSLYYAIKQRKCSCLTVGLELLRDGRVQKEFDFLFISEQKVYAGECKAGSELGDKDSGTALLAAKLGFHRFYFCTVRNFSSDTLRRIEETKSKLGREELKMEIEIITGTDLLGVPV